MKQKTKSILDELDALLPYKDKEFVLENRATHIIQGAINLINILRESYPPEVSMELERRLINSIKGQDPTKFTRGLRRTKINENQ